MKNLQEKNNLATLIVIQKLHSEIENTRKENSLAF